VIALFDLPIWLNQDEFGSSSWDSLIRGESPRPNRLFSQVIALPESIFFPVCGFPRGSASPLVARERWQPLNLFAARLWHHNGTGSAGNWNTAAL